MPPPRRTAPPGTAEAILEDLIFARDAGGMVRADEQRLAGTIQLLGLSPSNEALHEARELLSAATERTCAHIAEAPDASAELLAACHSVRTILLQRVDEPVLASTARREAIAKYRCFMQPDSLRKRELPVLKAIAEKVMEIGRNRKPEDLPEAEGLLERMAPTAALLAESMTTAIEHLAIRTQLDDDAPVVRALDYTYWLLSELLIWPQAASEAIRAIPNRPIEYSILEQECLAILVMPFEADPANLSVLFAARDQHPGYEGFSQHLAEMENGAVAARRLEAWLCGCTEGCAFHRSLTVAAMCLAHQYVALLEDFVDAVHHLRSGEYGAEVRRLLAPLFPASQQQRSV